VESTLKTAIHDFDNALIEDILGKMRRFSGDKPLSDWSAESDTPAFLGAKEKGEQDVYTLTRRATEGSTVLLSVLIKQDYGYEAWTASLGDSDGCKSCST
jgi:pyruvate dehydrogenase phosphatase